MEVPIRYNIVSFGSHYAEIQKKKFSNFQYHNAWNINLLTTAYNYKSFYCGRKEGNILFNDALNTFDLRLYGVTHMVKDHSDS